MRIPSTNLNIQGHLVEQVGNRAAKSPREQEKTEFGEKIGLVPLHNINVVKTAVTSLKAYLPTQVRQK